MSNTNKKNNASAPKAQHAGKEPSKAGQTAKKVALKVLPPLAFILVFCLLCGWIYSILIKNEKFAGLMGSVEYAVDVIINGVEEVPDTLTRAEPTNNVITLPYGVDSTAAFEVTLDDGTLQPDPSLEEGEDEPEEEPTEGEEATDAYVSHSMYVVFNGIANRQTGYFYTPDGTITLSAKATGESTGMKSFKIALWEKLPGEASYVPGSTIYFYTNDETNTYTITGLNPEKEYRMNFSYDAYGYYIYGVMQVDGVSFTAPPAEEAPVEEDEAA